MPLTTHTKPHRRCTKKIMRAVFKRKKQLTLHAQPIVVTNPSTSALPLPLQSQLRSSALRRSLNMPNEIQFLVDSAVSVYSVVSGASELPQPRGRSLMTSMMILELTPDTESDASICTPRTPISKCLIPIDDRQATSRSTRSQRRNSFKHTYLTETKYFKNLTEWSFLNMDLNKTGFVDKKDLYSGLLLIHLTLTKYAGIAACKPATCEHVFSVFDDLDVDCLGTLDKRQYQTAMAILSSQILQRVAIQWSTIILLVVPIILQYLTTGVMSSRIWS